MSGLKILGFGMLGTAIAHESEGDFKDSYIGASRFRASAYNRATNVRYGSKLNIFSSER